LTKNQEVVGLKRAMFVMIFLTAFLVPTQAQATGPQIEEIQLACVNPVYIITDDFNRDGYPDLAVACHSCDTIAAIPNGKGTCPEVFDKPAYWRLNDSPVALASGMFIEEPSGRNFPYTTVFPNITFVTQYLPDIARLSPLAPKGAFLDFQDGSVGQLAAIPRLATLTHLVVDDFNNDGSDDVVVLDGITPQIMGYFSNRAGPSPAIPCPPSSVATAKTPPVGPISLPGGVPRAQFLVAADFDRDGWLDLAVAAGGKIFFYENTFYKNPEQGFKIVKNKNNQPISIVVGTNVTSVAVADFNRDGYVDLAAVDPDFGTLAIIRNKGCWDFALWKRIKKDGGPYFVAILDCDRNGLPDIAVAERDADRVEIVLTMLKGTGYITRPDPCTRTVRPPELVDQVEFAPAFNISVKPGPVGLAIADYDRNGMQDIAVVLGGADGTTDPNSSPEVQVIYNPCCCRNCEEEIPCCPPEGEPAKTCGEEGGTKKGK